MGMLYPVTTVSIQNAVVPHQLGTATGAMNFFRSLGGALAVSGFSAIILGGGQAHEGLMLASLPVEASNSAGLTHSFGWLFAAAAGCIAAGLICLLVMEERPLRGEPVRAPQSAHSLSKGVSRSTTA